MANDPSEDEGEPVFVPRDRPYMAFRDEVLRRMWRDCGIDPNEPDDRKKLARFFHIGFARQEAREDRVKKIGQFGMAAFIAICGAAIAYVFPLLMHRWFD